MRLGKKYIINKRRINSIQITLVFPVSPLKPIFTGRQWELKFLPLNIAGPFTQYSSVQGEIKNIPILFRTNLEMKRTDSGTCFLIEHQCGLLTIGNSTRAQRVNPIVDNLCLAIPNLVANTTPA